MKIVLIAAFSNDEVRKHLTFRKTGRLYQGLIKFFRLPQRVGDFREIAPWIPGVVAEIEKHPDLDLHVIGPHIRLKRRIEEFELRGTHYHFYRSDFMSFLRTVGSYKLWYHLQGSGRIVRRILKRIDPDLVVLSGAENPVSSAAVLASGGYPRLCLCQTIYNNPERSAYSTPNKLIQDLEKDIFSQLHYFGVFSGLHYRLLREMNPAATILKYGFPSKGVLWEPDPSIVKQYDFVNFALMHGSRKGTPDSIQALAIVKRQYPDVTLNIVGGCDGKGKERLERLVRELGLESNVIFTPFFEKRSDLMAHIQKSRFAVLPCKLDHTAGTMSQAMQLGLPLVVYKTTGTPSFNRDRMCALIAEKGDVNGLAEHMMSLLKDERLAASLRKNARALQESKMAVARENGERLIAIFKAVADKEKRGIDIPTEYLFNSERDD